MRAPCGCDVERQFWMHRVGARCCFNGPDYGPEHPCPCAYHRGLRDGLCPSCADGTHQCDATLGASCRCWLCHLRPAA